MRGCHILTMARKNIRGTLIDVFTIIGLSMVLVPLLVSMVAGLLGRSLGLYALLNEDVTTILAMFAQEAALFWLTTMVLVTSGYSLRDINFTLAGWPRFLLVGLASGAVMLVINSLGNAYSVRLFQIFVSPQRIEALLEQENAVLTQLFRPDQPRWLIVSLFILVGIIAPIVEELFFRGYAYNIMRSRWGCIGGVVGGALLFAAVHLYIVQFFSIFILGTVLCLLYEKTGSLLPNIIAHSVMNLLVAWVVYGQIV